MFGMIQGRSCPSFADGSMFYTRYCGATGLQEAQPPATGASSGSFRDGVS